MRRAAWLAALLLVAACFELQDLDSFPCATDGTCPSGFVCEQVGTTYQCLTPSAAAVSLGDAGPSCCSGRYAVDNLGSGAQCGACPGPACDGSGMVRDHATGLIWTRKPSPALGQAEAGSFCNRLGMRLPTQAEALAIAGTNNDTCAFPCAWQTWTSTAAPQAAQYSQAVVVGSDGKVGDAVTSCSGCTFRESAPTLCVDSGQEPETKTGGAYPACSVAAPVDAGADSSSDSGAPPPDPGSTLSTADIACQSQGDACVDCCGEGHPSGARVFATTLVKCLCSSPGACATECASTVCAGETANPTCQSCLADATSSDGVCTGPIDDACPDGSDCVKYLRCGAACP